MKQVLTFTRKLPASLRSAMLERHRQRYNIYVEPNHIAVKIHDDVALLKELDPRAEVVLVGGTATLVAVRTSPRAIKEVFRRLSTKVLASYEPSTLHPLSPRERARALHAE